MSDGPSIPPPAPRSTVQRYLHAAIVGFVTGVLTFLSGAAIAGVTTQVAIRAVVFGTLAAGISSAAGAVLRNWTRDNPET
jgi:hypothetical protein